MSGSGLCLLLYVQALVGMCVLPTNVFAQKGSENALPTKQAAIYFTAEEAECQCPVLSFSVGDSRYRIKEVWLTDRKVKVISPDSVWVAAENNCWGYSDGKHTFRFFDQGRYQVLDHHELLWIYGQWRGENFLYFFSRSAGGPVYYLTKRNLKKAFADSPRFLNLLTYIHFLRPPTSIWRGSMRIITLYRLSRKSP